MKKIAFVFLAAMTVLSFAGCKKKGAMGDAVAKMEGFRDEACACKDKACADGVSKKMDDWGKSQPTGDKAPKPSEADMKKMTDIATKMGECLQKHEAPAPTPTPTPEPAGTAPAGEGSAPAPAGEGSAPAPAGSAAPAGSGSN